MLGRWLNLWGPLCPQLWKREFWWQSQFCNSVTGVFFPGKTFLRYKVIEAGRSLINTSSKWAETLKLWVWESWVSVLLLGSTDCFAGCRKEYGLRSQLHLASHTAFTVHPILAGWLREDFWVISSSVSWRYYALTCAVVKIKWADRGRSAWYRAVFSGVAHVPSERPGVWLSESASWVQGTWAPF